MTQNVIFPQSTNLLHSAFIQHLTLLDSKNMDSSNTIPVEIKTKITAAYTVLHLTNHPIKLIVKADLNDHIPMEEDEDEEDQPCQSNVIYVDQLEVFQRDPINHNKMIVNATNCSFLYVPEVLPPIGPKILFLR